MSSILPVDPAYLALCRERAALLVARVGSSRPFTEAEAEHFTQVTANIYYRLNLYRCHMCGALWSGRGSLRPCVTHHASVCQVCEPCDF